VSNFALAIHIFLQISVILVTCRVVGWIGRRLLGQTQVVMEMVAGVLLGPSLFGVLAPEAQSWLFPKQLLVSGPDGAQVAVTHPSMAVLYVLAQIGLALYMFLIGIEFDANLLRGRIRGAGLVSGAGIVVPFVLGALLAPSLLARGDLFAPEVNLFSAVLFLGASMAITAFPMLARILYERGIAATSLGTLALTAGSVDDAIAWCLLAVVLGTFEGNPQIALVTIGGGLLYAVVMLTLGRRLLRSVGERVAREGLSSNTYTLIITLLMACAWLTDVIGIYAVFGAFVCGVAMPRGPLAEQVVKRTEQLTTALLLPMFFTFSGLNTKLGLVNTPELWLVTAAVILAAIVGKGVACALAARSQGESWRSSATIGVLMNARGLMELILLNIGLEAGVISPTLFTILALMAVVTTLMASPLYQWIAPSREELLGAKPA
jgi:Kef-type K+ transport system membrane component KefB